MAIKKSVTNIVLNLEPELYNKIEAKRKKMGFENIQQYFYSIARRDVFRKNSAGRPNEYVKAAKVMMMKKVLTTKGGKAFKL